MRLPFVALTFLLCTMCAELPDIDRNVCGNGAVEKGEQCDGVAVDGVPCYSSGVAQCHLDCSGTDHKCPTGFRCGADDVCRQPSGSFQLQSIDVGGEAQRLDTGDFDGDRRSDLVSIGSASTSIRFFDASGSASSPLLVSSGAGGTNVGLLSDDAIGSLVLTNSSIIPPLTVGGKSELAGGDVIVLHGNKSRTLLPSIYPNYPVDSPDVRFAGALSAGHRRLFVGAHFTFLGQEVDSFFTSEGDAGNATTEITTLPLAPSKYLTAGTIPQVGFPCESVVLVSDASALVIPTCKKQGNGVVIPNTKTVPLKDTTPQVPMVTVTLVDAARPVKPTLRPLYADLNGDGRSDLIIPGYGVSYVALGVADGTFNSTAPVPASNGDNKATATTLFNLGTPPNLIGTTQAPIAPLAVGSLDGDGLLDWFTSTSAYLSTVGQIEQGRRATDAFIGDFNGNGKSDALILSPGGLTFLNGNGAGALNVQEILFDGTPVNLAAGDFDGDFVKDFAVVVRGGSDLGDDDALYTLFGHAGGFPDAPQRTGVLTGTSDLVPFQGLPFQARDVLGAVSTGTGTSKLVTLLVGDANRQFSTPFQLAASLSQTQSVQGFPLQVLAGRFGGNRGIVALALDTPKADADGAMRVSPTDKLIGRLWFVPSNGFAQLDPAKTVISSGPTGELALSLREVRAAGAALIPSNDGQDILLVVNPADRAGGGKGKLLTAKLVNNAWSVDLPKEIGAYTKATDDLARFGYGARIAVGDFDGDGVFDAIVQAFDKSGSPVLAFLKNRAGVIDPPIDMPVPPDLVAIAAVRTDKSGRASLAMITRAATTTKSSMWLGGIDSGGGPKKPTEALALSGAPVVDALGADVNGDGVDDLIVSHGSSVEIHLGVAEVP